MGSLCQPRRLRTSSRVRARYLLEGAWPCAGGPAARCSSLAGGTVRLADAGAAGCVDNRRYQRRARGDEPSAGQATKHCRPCVSCREAVDLSTTVSDPSPDAREQAATSARPARDAVMRGREAEQKAVRDLLRRARPGMAAVTLVKGSRARASPGCCATPPARLRGRAFRRRRARRKNSAGRYRSSRCAPRFPARPRGPPPMTAAAICPRRPRGGSVSCAGAWRTWPRPDPSSCAWTTCTGRARRRSRRSGHCQGN